MSEIYDSMDKDVVMGCVEKGTRDKKVINLIKSVMIERVSTHRVEGASGGCCTSSLTTFRP